jgi:hypothetical protein
MGDLAKDVTSIFMAIIGIAILALLVSRNSNTTGVLGSVFSGFAQDLSAAGNVGNGGYMPFSSGVSFGIGG